MEMLETLPPAVALVLSLFALIWLVLLFLLPFMIESIRGWTRKTHHELHEINNKLDRLAVLLGDKIEAPAPRPERGEQGRRERKEPTISDLGSLPTGTERRPPSAGATLKPGARR
jgi:hypothetical protein